MTDETEKFSESLRDLLNSCELPPDVILGVLLGAATAHAEAHFGHAETLRKLDLVRAHFAAVPAEADGRLPARH